MPFRLASALLFAAFAMSTPALAAKVSLAGQVTYRERIALPDPATLRIQLFDETLAGAPLRLDVEAPTGTGQVPLSFTLGFDDSLIIPGHNYALIATISAGGGMLFRNFEPYALEPLAPDEPVVIVTNFVGQLADGASSEQPADPGTPAILESTWTATAIGDTPVVPGSTSSLQVGTDMRAGGVGGCNSYFAPVQLDGDAIRFGAVTSTMKSCGQAKNLQEKAYYEALGMAATWRVSGDQLTLYGADGKAVLAFVR